MSTPSFRLASQRPRICGLCAPIIVSTSKCLFCNKELPLFQTTHLIPLPCWLLFPNVAFDNAFLSEDVSQELGASRCGQSWQCLIILGQGGEGEVPVVAMEWIYWLSPRFGLLAELNADLSGGGQGCWRRRRDPGGLLMWLVRGQFRGRPGVLDEEPLMRITCSSTGLLYRSALQFKTVLAEVNIYRQRATKKENDEH